MAELVIEGTWEELARQAERFSGKRLRVTVLGAGERREDAPNGPASLPDEFRDRILGLERRYNWDGAGARAVCKSACKAAVQFLEWARAHRPDLSLPRPSPSPRGGVMLTWRSGERHLTVRFSSGEIDPLPYEWEGPDYDYGSGTGSREEVLARILALASQAGGSSRAGNGLKVVEGAGA